MPTRFEELKVRGWKQLSSSERAEYVSLKPKEVSPKGVETKKGDTVTITKDELNEVIQKGILAAMEQYKTQMDGVTKDVAGIRDGKWTKVREVKKGNPTARIKIFREDGDSAPGVLIDWKFLKHGFNEETRRNDILIYRITVLYEGGEKKQFDVPWIDVISGEEFETVEIIKQDIEPQEMRKGFGELPVNKNGYMLSNPGFFGTKQQASDGSFEYVVTRKVVVCTVKRPNGEILVLDASRLNS